MRVIGALVAAYLIVACAITQLASLVVLQGVAAPYALPRALPASWGLPLAQLAYRLLPTPWNAESAARAAVARGDDALAQRWIRRMPQGGYALALEATIAERRGEAESAVADDLRDGDAGALARIVDGLAAHDLPRALRLQRHVVAALDADPTHPPSRAEAYWRLGELSARSGDLRSASSAYRRAIELSPYAGLYALSYAQHLWYALHDGPAAERYFLRTLRDDPTASPAYEGLAAIASARGDRAAAASYLRKAHAIEQK
ncbi:MAG: hypothetical protein KGM44_02035 [bacterium]|nr:hypothetical protein [bacterium]